MNGVAAAQAAAYTSREVKLLSVDGLEQSVVLSVDNGDNLGKLLLDLSKVGQTRAVLVGNVLLCVLNIGRNEQGNLSIAAIAGSVSELSADCIDGAVTEACAYAEYGSLAVLAALENQCVFTCALFNLLNFLQLQSGSDNRCGSFTQSIRPDDIVWRVK